MLRRLQRRWPHFEIEYNKESNDIADVIDDYKILTTVALDDEGAPLPKRVTGFDMTPAAEHDRLTAIAIAEIWRTSPDEQLDSITASEFMRRLALAKARTFSQPTPAQMRENRNKKQIGR